MAQFIVYLLCKYDFTESFVSFLKNRIGTVVKVLYVKKRKFILNIYEVNYRNSKCCFTKESFCILKYFATHLTFKNHLQRNKIKYTYRN